MAGPYFKKTTTETNGKKKKGVLRRTDYIYLAVAEG